MYSKSNQARHEADEQLTWTAHDAGVRAFLLTNLATVVEIDQSSVWEVEYLSSLIVKQFDTRHSGCRYPMPHLSRWVDMEGMTFKQKSFKKWSNKLTKT
jgi:hypothetical protein